MNYDIRADVDNLDLLDIDGGPLKQCFALLNHFIDSIMFSYIILSRLVYRNHFIHTTYVLRRLLLHTIPDCQPLSSEQ